MNNKTLKKVITFSVFFILFIFRFVMGLSKFAGDDELQIYLIGLQSFTTKIYPFFGPDVVYSQTQIPGGLQGLLISIPIQLLGIPEAPYILLNILTFAALAFLGWYISRRISNVPKWFIYIWILTCPWALNYSTHIENPSYVLVGAILFFIAVFDLGHFYKTRLLNDKLSFAFLGFSLFWIMQLHLSWVLLPPYLLWLIWVNRNDKKLLLRGLLYFVLGALVSVSTLIPTLVTYNLGGLESNIVFNTGNIKNIPTIIFRFFSFASYEIPRFIGYDTPSRISYLMDQPWVIPVVLFLLLVGFFQAGYFIYSLFVRKGTYEWNKVRMFTVYTLLLICISFLFSISNPGSHTFYLSFPIAIWYSFHTYGKLFTYRIKKLVVVFLISGILFQLSLFVNRFHEESLFAHRTQVVKAISAMDYTFVGTRRESKLLKERKEAIWIEKKQTGSLTYYADLEVKDPYFREQNIVNNIAYKGKYSCKVDSIQPFGATFVTRMKSSEMPTQVTLSFYVKANGIEDFILVYEVRNTENSIWKSMDLKEKYIPGQEWRFIKLEFELPEITEDETEVAMYFWMKNKSGAVLYVDDLELGFKY